MRIDADASLAGILALAERLLDSSYSFLRDRPKPRPGTLYPSGVQASMPEPTEQLTSTLSMQMTRVNKFFNLDELPYPLTEFSISESRTLRPRVERFLSRIRPRPKQLGSPIVSSHTQPQALPIRIPKIEAYPQIIRRESEVMYQTAIEPVLILLAGPAFREANREFLDALKDYRNGDYRDCVVDCGSSLESVMKIICEQKRWPPQRDAGKLLNTILSRTDLPEFLKQPLIQTAVIRNELGSAHGAGAEPRTVAKHLAQYAINVTASAILLLVEETIHE